MILNLILNLTDIFVDCSSNFKQNLETYMQPACFFKMFSCFDLHAYEVSIDCENG